jgi:hypothetical protein
MSDLLPKIGKLLGLNSSSENPPDKRTCLLAFRTIITMLSSIQSSNTRLDVEIKARIIGTGDKDLGELKVLDALSAVLIRENETIAVVARPSSCRDNDGSILQVFASVVNPINSKPLLQYSANHSFWNLARSFIIAPNPRNAMTNNHTDSLMNSTLLPILGHPQAIVPVNLVTAEWDSLLDIYLKTYW